MKRASDKKLTRPEGVTRMATFYDDLERTRFLDLLTQDANSFAPYR